ncbi:MAG: hypothetical protein AB7S99_17565 [Pseudodonghicola sp.]
MVDIDLNDVKRQLRRRKLVTVLLPWLAVVSAGSALLWAWIMWTGDEFSRLGSLVVSLGFVVFYVRARWFARFSESFGAAERVVGECFVALVATSDSVEVAATIVNELIPKRADDSGMIDVKTPPLLEATKKHREYLKGLRAEFEEMRRGYGWQEVLLAVSGTLVSGYGAQLHQFFNT